eukprot:15353709-Ditylum_brightwellii.AAC.1
MFHTSQEESDEEQDIESDIDDKEDIDPEFEQMVEYAEENENEHAIDGSGNSLDYADNNMDDFLLSSLESDLELAEDDDIGNGNYIASRDNDNNLDQYVDTVQTANAGEYSMEIGYETEYGRTFGNIKISGSVILNQC